jgi:hypothetical protein
MRASALPTGSPATRQKDNAQDQERHSHAHEGAGSPISIYRHSHGFVSPQNSPVSSFPIWHGGDRCGILFGATGRQWVELGLAPHPDMELIE